MFDFGDELIIDSYRIPWLIWIQLLAMFLLLILLYYFTATPTSDLSPISTASASHSTTGLSYLNHSLLTSSAAATTHQISKEVGENEIKETGTSTSEVVQRAKRGDVTQRRDEGNVGMMFERSQSHHPCNFFGLAKQAFLKCLGIDSTIPENNSSTRQSKKDD